MRKFRASMESFWDLKIGKYVEHLISVSSEYLISCELLSLTSSAGQTSRVFLAYVIPWIHKASLALCIARSVAVPRPPYLKFRSCTGPSSSSLWLRLVTIESFEVKSRSQTPSLLAYDTMHALHRRPFTICTITTMQLLGTWSPLHIICTFYPYYPCMHTSLTCHPYFTLQFYSIVFDTLKQHFYVRVYVCKLCESSGGCILFVLHKFLLASFSGSPPPLYFHTCDFIYTKFCSCKGGEELWWCADTDDVFSVHYVQVYESKRIRTKKNVHINLLLGFLECSTDASIAG